MERCFLCKKKMNVKTGLCTNTKCVRSRPLESRDSKERTKKMKEG